MPKLTVSNLLIQLHADLRGNTERGKLVRSAGMTAGMKIGATLLAFGASLLYARALGPHDYGLYAYVIAWTAILTIPAGLGLPQYLVREGAKAPESLSWLCRWADKRVLVAGSLAGILLACAVFIPAAAGARWLFVIAAPLPLLSNLSAVRRSLLQAHGRIARSQWPQLLFAPGIVLAIVAGLWLWRGRFDSLELITATVVVALLPLIINTLQLRDATQDAAHKQPISARVQSAFPFMWLGGLYLLLSRTDLIMLGSLRGAHDAGIYAVASRAAELLVFVGMAANTAAAPTFARLHKDGNTELLQRLTFAMGRRVLLVTAPVALIMIVFAAPLLSLLYGSAYAQGSHVMQILGVAQLVVVIGGPMGTLLNMSGHERLHLYGISVSLIVNILLNVFFIPHFGATGAAMATCISVILSRVILLLLVRRYLGIRPSALGI